VTHPKSWLAPGAKRANRKLKALTIIDDCTKEAVGIHVGHSISGLEVTRFLDSLGVLPDRIRTDNGPEFDSTAFHLWCENKLDHEFITAGKPNENAYIESFNSRFRDECLNEHIFRNLEDAKRKIEEWRRRYNEEHPHSSLGMRTPKEFALEYQKMLTG
jgi:putative transposase